MGTELVRPLLDPPREVRSHLRPIRGENIIASDFLRTKTKLLLLTSPTKALMGSTQSGPQKPLLQVPQLLPRGSTHPHALRHLQEVFPRSGLGGPHETFC